jgi:hypothetical protein
MVFSLLVPLSFFGEGDMDGTRKAGPQESCGRARYDIVVEKYIVYTYKEVK